MRSMYSKSMFHQNGIRLLSASVKVSFVLTVMRWTCQHVSLQEIASIGDVFDNLLDPDCHSCVRITCSLQGYSPQSIKQDRDLDLVSSRTNRQSPGRSNASPQKTLVVTTPLPLGGDKRPCDVNPPQACKFWADLQNLAHGSQQTADSRRRHAALN